MGLGVQITSTLGFLSTDKMVLLAAGSGEDSPIGMPGERALEALAQHDPVGSATTGSP